MEQIQLAVDKINFVIDVVGSEDGAQLLGQRGEPYRLLDNPRRLKRRPLLDSRPPLAQLWPVRDQRRRVRITQSKTMFLCIRMFIALPKPATLPPLSMQL